MRKIIYKNTCIIAVLTAIITAAVTFFICYIHSGDSLLETVLGTAFALALLVIAVLVLVAFMSNKVSGMIVEPMNNADIEHLSEAAVHKEFIPFLKRIADNYAEKEEIEKIRREFSANVSHELKTPLTSISGYAQMITTGMAKEKDIRSFGEKIERESSRLILLINDIIKLSNLDESNGIEDSQDVDLYYVAHEVLANINDNALRHGVQLFAGGSKKIIKGNATLIGELVYNLVDNAIKYNKENGKVTVTVSENEKGAVLSVKDNGIGIPDEEQERIFERFYRVDKSHSKTVGGTGLGLSIVKHIAKCHNAEIVLKSKFGKGTEVMVIFPLGV